MADTFSDMVADSPVPVLSGTHGMIILWFLANSKRQTSLRSEVLEKRKPPHYTSKELNSQQKKKKKKVTQPCEDHVAVEYCKVWVHFHTFVYCHPTIRRGLTEPTHNTDISMVKL